MDALDGRRGTCGPNSALCCALLCSMGKRFKFQFGLRAVAEYRFHKVTIFYSQGTQGTWDLPPGACPSEASGAFSFFVASTCTHTRGCIVLVSLLPSASVMKWLQASVSTHFLSSFHFISSTSFDARSAAKVPPDAATCILSPLPSHLCNPLDSFKKVLANGKRACIDVTAVPRLRWWRRFKGAVFCHDDAVKDAAGYHHDDLSMQQVVAMMMPKDAAGFCQDDKRM
eukprot:1130654-Pelagomonas_calceolata.AAC.6